MNRRQFLAASSALALSVKSEGGFTQDLYGVFVTRFLMSRKVDVTTGTPTQTFVEFELIEVNILSHH